MGYRTHVIKTYHTTVSSKYIRNYLESLNLTSDWEQTMLKSLLKIEDLGDSIRVRNYLHNFIPGDDECYSDMKPIMSMLQDNFDCCGWCGDNEESFDIGFWEIKELSEETLKEYGLDEDKLRIWNEMLEFSKSNHVLSDSTITYKFW